MTASSTKFYYCVSSFNQETANQVLDLIKSPPATDPYEALKIWLLKLFALDDFQRYEAISNLPLSGDMKPSKLMSNILALLPVGHEPHFFLKGAFLKRLLAHIRAHLLRDDFSDPISFTLKADEIYQSRVSSSPAPQRTSSPSTPLDHQFLTAPVILLLLTPAAARIAGPSLLPCVIITVHGVPRPRNAELHVPGRETSSLAGGCSYPSCRDSYFISFSLITRFTVTEIPH